MNKRTKFLKIKLVISLKTPSAITRPQFKEP